MGFVAFELKFETLTENFAYKEGDAEKDEQEEGGERVGFIERQKVVMMLVYNIACKCVFELD